MDVIIKMKNGTTKKFEDHGRPGGSYSQRIKYEGAFAVITDCYDNQTAIPASDIEEVVTNTHGGRW